ncbi:MAG: hypothetical protein ABSH08_22330, partial [Tepidisphaeraceae bacterium]
MAEFLSGSMPTRYNAISFRGGQMIWIGRHAAAALIFAALFWGRSWAAPTSQPVIEAFPTASAEDQKLESLLDRRLPSVQLAGVKLSDSLDFVRDVTGTNIYVDWKAVEL